MGAHLIDGEFQSDKYPTCPRGKVPLSTKDPMAQDLLWEYAKRHREVDPEFSDDLETTLYSSGFTMPPHRPPLADLVLEASELLTTLTGEEHPVINLSYDWWIANGQRRRVWRVSGTGFSIRAFDSVRGDTAEDTVMALISNVRRELAVRWEEMRKQLDEMEQKIAKLGIVSLPRTPS